MIEMLSQELHEIFVGHLLEDPYADAAARAHSRDILRMFRTLDALPCKTTVKTDVAKAILKDNDPVNIFFARLPSVDEYEMIRMGSSAAPDLFPKHDRALAVLEHLTIMYGKHSMVMRHGDEILQGLFRLLVLAREFRRSTKFYGIFLRDGMIEELHAVALGIESGTPILQESPQYNQNTCILINYFGWVSRGVKDSECAIQKLWEVRGPADLRMRAPRNLSHLSINGRSSQGAEGLAAQASVKGMCCWPHPDEEQTSGTYHSIQVCGTTDTGKHTLSCRETLRFCRLARLFKLAFTKFVLCNTGMKRTVHDVSMSDGIVESTISLRAANNPSLALPYAGIPVDLDLSLPHVEAALHAYWCCAITDSARSLLEYFFGSSTAEIEFIYFLPKNAHTPVRQVITLAREKSTFNMLASHTVAVLTTPSGLEFILDPTAAQYGWRENIAPREIYTRCRVDYEYPTKPCYRPDPQRLPTKATTRPEAKRDSDLWAMACVAEQIVERVREHLTEIGGLDGVLQLPRAQFEEQCQALQQALESGLNVSQI